jgi:CheY-like chemotaxis protein
MGFPVLLVDDDDDIRMLLRVALEEQGYTVFEAPDGAPALERLRIHPAGMVVLLDLRMPGVDGYAVLRAVAQPTVLAARHAYVVMSADTPDQLRTIRQEFAGLGVTFFAKPFDLGELLDAVATAAERLGAGTSYPWRGVHSETTPLPPY